MATLPERLSSLEKGVEENNKTTWKIHDAIFGRENEKPGIITEIHLIRQSVDQHIQNHRDSKTDWKWLVTSAIAIAALAAAIF